MINIEEFFKAFFKNSNSIMGEKKGEAWNFEKRKDRSLNYWFISCHLNITNKTIRQNNTYFQQKLFKNFDDFKNLHSVYERNEREKKSNWNQVKL